MKVDRTGTSQADPPGRAFVVLLDGEAGEEVAATMADAVNPDVEYPAVIMMHTELAVGMEYLAATGAAAATLDRDWAKSVDVEKQKGVFILKYEDGLANLLGGLDAEFVIGCPDVEALARCRAGAESPELVHGVVSTDDVVIGEFAMMSYSAGRGERALFDVALAPPKPEAPAMRPSPARVPPPAAAADEDLAGLVQDEIESSGFDLETLETLQVGAEYPMWDAPESSGRAIEVELPPSQSAAPPAVVSEVSVTPALAHEDAAELPDLVPPKDSFLGYLSRATMPSVPDVEVSPLELPPPIARATKIVPPAPAKRAPAAGGASALIQSLAKPMLQRIGVAPQEIRIKADPVYATRLSQLRGLCAVVGNAKGGTGKTATSVGTAAVLGLLGNLRGMTTALADGNLGNVSSWGTTGIRQDKCSVAQAIQILNESGIPPGPAGANTPGLVIYREEPNRGGSYTADELSRFKEFVLTSHGALVVDLANRLPDMASKEGEAVKHWMHLADVFIVPMDPDEDSIGYANAFIDAIEVMVDARGPGSIPVPVVVAYLAPKDRAVRNLPALREDLRKLGERVQAIVEVPRDERYYLAQRLGKPITEVSKGLTKAYTQVAHEVIDAALLARAVSR